MLCFEAFDIYFLQKKRCHIVKLIDLDF